MAYNPFDKPIGNRLDLADLHKLQELKVIEGYYVEYKEDFPAPEKIGQSLASFANTYGGWYLIGIKTDQQHLIAEIPGFSVTEWPDPIAKVQEIVRNNLDPAPIFFAQVIEVARDRAVLVIYVPDQQETPFVFKDGRIYRRAYESSDPLPETNRYTIDRLVDAGREMVRQFEKFCQDDAVTQYEVDQGWVKLFLSPHPLGTVAKQDMLSKESINKLLQMSRRQIQIPFGESMVMVSGVLPFNFGRPTHQSVILRQIEPTNLTTNSLTAEFFTNGQAKFFIPLHYFPALQHWDMEQLQSEQVKITLKKLIESDSGSSFAMRFFDIGQLWLTVACLMCYYQEWLGEAPLLEELQFAVTIKEIWRTVPFFDSDEWGSYVQEFGLPVMGDETIKIPSDLNRGGIRIALGSEWPLWLEICYFLSLSFGLPPELYSNTLLQTVERSVKQQEGL